jgi:predicted transglutaminase-like cysteine proteinase
MLTDEQYAVIRKTFDHVLSIFEYAKDIDVYNVLEHWEDPTQIRKQLDEGKIVGDCDNFALACRYLLNQANIPNRLVMCSVEGEGHLVCEVDGWILDNRQTRVRSWGELNYTWLKISGYKAGDPWHEIAAST